jgi:hypothetical protein
MSYLPDELPKAKVLITVKTYPFPSSDHGEVVCTAGLTNEGNWIRMYPISSRMYDEKRYPKYGWVELDLVKHRSDKRLESYMPRRGLDEPMRLLSKMGTEDKWAARREIVQKEVFTSLKQLISLSRPEDSDRSLGRSLGTLRPKEIIDFSIKKCEREWTPKQIGKLKQMNLFELDSDGQAKQRHLVKKLPYDFKYNFLSEGDEKPRELTIRDWEIGTLFWNCLKQSDGDEIEAKKLVRKKYFDEFLSQKDILLFLGTTYEFHLRRVENPFIIIGVFYPPKTSQLPLPL